MTRNPSEIPTASEWMLMLMAMMLGALGFWKLR
ncbi:MAG: IPTL-CTERM sorting domain-containing protein [Acidobacteria bacterium]|nr:IPTL-CTERM sorting domain-containing protein [Acidobacteriota bacterium]